MSKHSSHRRTSKLLTGDEHNEVNRWLDAPAATMGRSHRRLFHDPMTSPLLGAIAASWEGKDPAGGAMAGLAHAAQDRVTSFVRRSLPRPLRPLYPMLGAIAEHTILSAADLPPTDTPPTSDGTRTVEDADPAAEERILPQHPSSWWLTKAGHRAAFALVPATCLVASVLSVWVVAIVGTLAERSTFGALVGAMGVLGLAVTDVRLTVLLLLVLACACIYAGRCFNRWWMANQPWRPALGEAGVVTRADASGTVHVLSERAGSPDAWIPRAAFPTSRRPGDAPAAPVWVIWLAFLTVMASLVLVALVAVAWGSRSEGGPRRSR